MRSILLFVVAAANFKAAVGVQCADINFNDAQLHLAKCSGTLSWMKEWSVLAFKDQKDFTPRNAKTTHYISKSGGWDDVCGETPEYEADARSYVVIGFYIEKISDKAFGELYIDLMVDKKVVEGEVIKYTDSEKTWREKEIKISTKGALMVRLRLGTNEYVKAGVDYIRIYNTDDDQIECKPGNPTQPPTTTNQPPTTTNQPSTITNQPPTTTNQPSTTTNQPSTITNQPPTTTNKPPTTVQTTMSTGPSTLQPTVSTSSTTLRKPGSTSTSTTSDNQSSTRPPVAPPRPSIEPAYDQTLIAIIAAVSVASAVFVTVCCLVIFRRFRLMPRRRQSQHMFATLPRLTVNKNNSISGVGFGKQWS